ncbi:MAG: holo-ACP synthase [Rickettsiales bacterium]|jgi:holo-[acyl-carrier protein] synthase|nr:holo-ACP synthase [Rickettsiales bacterium]
MILGIGNDIAVCSRFLEWTEFKKNRIFTKKEIAYASEDNCNEEKHLAKFWAAREAFVKALGTGFDDGIAFTDVSVLHDERGAPELLIAGEAKKILAAKSKDARVHLALSDDGDYALANVVIEG